jgi:hypothetical protein
MVVEDEEKSLRSYWKTLRKRQKKKNGIWKTERDIGLSGELAVEGTADMSQYGLYKEWLTITNRTREEYYTMQILPNMQYHHTFYPQVMPVVFFLQFTALNNSIHFFSPMPINSSKLNFLYMNKIMLGDIFYIIWPFCFSKWRRCERSAGFNGGFGSLLDGPACYPLKLKITLPFWNVYISVYTRAPLFDNKCCYCTRTDVTFFMDVDTWVTKMQY